MFWQSEKDKLDWLGLGAETLSDVKIINVGSEFLREAIQRLVHMSFWLVKLTHTDNIC